MDNNLNSITYSPTGHFTGSMKELNEILEGEILKNREKVKELREGKKETLEEQVSRIRKKYKKNENLYESFDPAKFEIKTRIDLLFFEHVCQNLPEISKMPELISSYYRTVRDLYETVNMKPENHKMLPSSVLNESYSDQQKRFSKILSEHVNNNYYRYSSEKRATMYLDESQEYAKELVGRGLDSDESIRVAVKAAILESLIEGIAIPKYVRRRIKGLCEDVDYGKAFDQDHLKSLWESFQKKTKNVARILAAAI